MQHYLRVESDVLVAYSAVKLRALLPALVGSGLVGKGSSPRRRSAASSSAGSAAGEGIVASSDNGDGGGATSVTNAAAVNLGCCRSASRPTTAASRATAARFLRRPAP